MRVVVFLLFVAALAGCPATPYCHCQLSNRCVELKEDCQADNITCNAKPGLDGKCPPDAGVGSCVVDKSRTDYYYSPQFTSETAHDTCDGGFFTPLP